MKCYQCCLYCVMSASVCHHCDLINALLILQLHTSVFQAIIVAPVLYALPARGCFLSRELSGRLDAFFKRVYRYGFTSNIEHVGLLFDMVCTDLFNKICWTEPRLARFFLRAASFG